VESTDAHWVTRALGTWECSERWDSVWALTPSPELLAEKLWHDVPWQKVVQTGRKSSALLQLTQLNMGSGIGHLELLQSPAALPVIDACANEFVAKAFETFPLRKLILMAGADCLTLPESIERRADQVGALKAHLRRGAGHYVDLRIYEIWAP
jgi:hypothetical protein